ncbi:MAG TPA: PaaX family transcriptional regulator C-terminal domain-containing protein [Acidimicrobiales bacterium]|nr:PaaX family transcriptional regulator C-terminal domain-containing protein [Acidimicrobiales bacterium]
MTAIDLADVNLPRVQTGANPQHLIVTLFGDYWFGRRDHLPSSALVALAGEFGITVTSARAALSRLARRGLLDSSRVGRRTYYGLTPRAADVLGDGLHRVMTFGLDHRPWDGSWVVVIFSVPEDQRDVRHVLRTRLRWLGFAPLYDGVWVSPRAHEGEAAALLTDLGVGTSTVFASRAVHGQGGGDPLNAWDLDDLRAGYDDFVARFGPLLDRVRSGNVGAAEALVARTQVMDEWRQFPGLDPELPEDALPRGWPRRRAQAIFARVYDALGPLAEVRFQQILGEHAPGLARHGRHLTTTGVTRRTRRPAGA